MLLSEIMRQPVLEMAYRKKKAEAVITGLEKPINTHLLKLLAVPGGKMRDDNVAHWKGELANWLDEVAEIRLKPDNRPGHPGFYFGILFDEPFGGSEVAGVASRLKRLARGPDAVAIRGDLDPRRWRRCCGRFTSPLTRGALPGGRRSRPPRPWWTGSRQVTAGVRAGGGFGQALP